MKFLSPVIGLTLLIVSCSPPPNEGHVADPATVAGGGTDTVAVTTAAQHLDIPWTIAFLPSGDMLVTERPGTLLRISAAGQQRYPIDGVSPIGEGGLLGIAVHPEFSANRQIYLYLTSRENRLIRNRVERYALENDRLTDKTEIIGDIPGAVYHDGGALAFGPDGYLYITTGDAGNGSLSQDTSSLAGKILRVRDNGSVPEENPFGNAVYSYGHRNPQGIAWDEEGNLWSTEHGRSGALSGFDELNRIKPGGNYGWPDYQGDATAPGIEPPVLHSGPNATWAPASAAYLAGSIYFGGLKGEALYEVPLNTLALRTHLHRAYGRLRAAVASPEGTLYLTTSNTDGRGSARPGDDRLLTVDPSRL